MYLTNDKINSSKLNLLKLFVCATFQSRGRDRLYVSHYLTAEYFQVLRLTLTPDKVSLPGKAPGRREKANYQGGIRIVLSNV